MKLINITAEAHRALVACSPTVNTHGSAPTRGNRYLLQIDEETADMLAAKTKALGLADHSQTIIAVCSA